MKVASTSIEYDVLHKYIVVVGPETQQLTTSVKYKKNGTYAFKHY